MINEEKINILIVDDHPENLLALEAIIERDEYNLIKAHSGEEALKQLLKYDFALILLDVQMPGMDGFNTAKIIKAREKTKNIPILFITANNLDSEHIFMGYSVGAIDYILKPFDPIILKSKVERFVEIYQLRQMFLSQAEDLAKKNKVIEYMAYHDGLTDLPNRRMFNDQLITKISKAKLLNESLGVMYLDLDRFKYINDSLGHLIGDKLLQQVAKRLSSTIRNEDFIARIGGDEFIVLLSNSDREMCLEVAQRIIDIFKKPFFIDKYEFYITICIGLSIFPYDGEDSNTIIRNADIALYRAKEQGKNTYNVFHSGMNIESYRTFLIQNDLRKAIERDELYLVYQPRVQIETEKVLSAEALLRWNHPKWGPISPGEFIPIAEETGLIYEIDEWVLNKVCEQINNWKVQNIEIPRIAVNYSAQHFLQKSLIDQINSILIQHNTNPKQIEIEITESAILGNEEIVNLTLSQIRELGITLSLDDFGVGYSSLNYLRNFPFHSVKIDKSFVDEITSNTKNSREIVESIIYLAKKLNLSVVAEGVETEEQLQILKKLQCEKVQGFIYSTPLLPMDFITYISKDNRVDLPKTLDSPSKTSLDINISSEQIGFNKGLIEIAINEIKAKYSLSVREVDVFRLIVDGLSNKEISEKLFISEHTVKNHITNLLSKLDVSDRVQAIALVYETCFSKR